MRFELETPRFDAELFPSEDDLGGGAVAVAPPARQARTSRRRAKARFDCPPAGVFELLARPLPRRKRLVDVIVSGTALVLLSPAMLVMALLVKGTSRGPVFFTQERTGTGMRRFRMYKFRTMTHRSDELRAKLGDRNEMTGPLFKMDDDPRLTTVGKWLRKLSLDELPQLWNVLRGDMTIIGPRALSPVPSEYEPWQLRRFDVTPGLACTWQAESRGSTDFAGWMRSDLRYIDRGVTFRSDLRTFLRTVVAVVTCAGSR